MDTEKSKPDRCLNSPDCLTMLADIRTHVVDANVRIKVLEHMLNENGNPEYVVRMDRVEQELGRIRRGALALWGIVSALAIYVGTKLLERIFRGE